MPLELQYQRAMRDLQSVSPEVRAVRDPSALLGAYGRAATQQKLAEEQSAMNIRGMRAQTELEKQDRKMARRDARLALPLTVAGMGVRALGTYEERQAAQEQERMAQEDADRWETIYQIRLAHADEIERILNGESEAQPNPSQEWEGKPTW